MGHFRSNAVHLAFSRNLTISKGVVVEVRSWNQKQKTGFTSSWPKKAKTIKAGESESKTQVYRKTVANLTADEALKLAQKLYTQIIQHEMKLSGSLPADNDLDCTQVLSITGTDTAFDQIYRLEKVTRTMSVSEGYRMSISAKNTSPELENLQ